MPSNFIPAPRRTFALAAVVIAGLVLALLQRSAPSVDVSPADTPTQNRLPAGPSGSGNSNTTRAGHHASGDEWMLRWRESLNQPDSDERRRRMLALLEELAANDPARALEFARGESDPDLRTDLFQAVLRGWAMKAPEAAIEWAASQSELDQGLAAAAAFHGAAADPENAVRLAGKFSTQDPERAGDYGNYLIAALGSVGEYRRGAEFAAEAPSESRIDLLNAAYSLWANSDPRTALEHIAGISDPQNRQTAFAAAVSRWADRDSKAAAAYAFQLPAGADKTLALSMALRSWSGADGPEAATWMTRLDPSPELDFGAATVASLPETLNQPRVAAGWAESITDSRLKVRVLALVMNEWAATDPAAARHYAETLPGLTPEERAGVLDAFEPGFKPISLLP